ncbi:NeuD/PglB/VioB family sugar acetyltransferase [Rhodanobacter aciditrophus]|uniref:NeuD/PglB/VioB family sugar acetyltransferase n=1 Tax=Rhodanobacter aciditrophus TaxID=1623218 RepID=UPI003CE6FAD2
MNIIFGAGGVASELDWLLAEGAAGTTAAADAFCVPDTYIAPENTFCGKPIIRESELDTFLDHREFDAYIAIGTPIIKRKVVSWLERYFSCRFPNVIHPSVTMDSRKGKVTLGKGILIYPGATLTTSVEIGSFVHVNPGSTIGHHAKIGCYSTLCPGSNISGSVSIGKDCFVGAGAVIRDGIHITDACVVGAGAVVAANIDQSGTWVGVPARRMD